MKVNPWFAVKCVVGRSSISSLDLMTAKNLEWLIINIKLRRRKIVKGDARACESFTRIS